MVLQSKTIFYHIMSVNMHIMFFLSNFLSDREEPDISLRCKQSDNNHTPSIKSQYVSVVFTGSPYATFEKSLSL